jgi:hypothetical protein
VSGVDVLAVLADQSARLWSVASNMSRGSDLTSPMRQSATDLDSARAAIAELIDAAEDVAFNDLPGYGRLRDALSAVRPNTGTKP